MIPPDDLPAERLKELRDRLRLDDEPSPPSAEVLLVWQFIPLEAGLPGWRAERVRRLAIDHWPPATRSTWRPADAAGEDVLLLLDTYECVDSSDARRWMLRLLASVQSTAIARLEQEAPGDIAFGMPGGGSVISARANLIFHMRNGGHSVRSVAEAARALDRWVAEPPGQDGRLVPEFIEAEVRPGEADAGGFAIQLEARDPADRPVWFRISSPSGALFLVDGRPRYRPDTDATPAALTVAAVGEGGAAVRTIEISPGRGRQRGTAGAGR